MLNSLNVIARKNVIESIPAYFHQVAGIMTWFGNVSGSNALEESDILCVIGFPMIGYDDLVKGASKAFGVNWDKHEINHIGNQALYDNINPCYKKVSFYDDKVLVQVPVKSFSDPSIEAYYQMTCFGDYIQALGRIRPFSENIPCNKIGLRHLLVISNQPTGFIPVDRLTTTDRLTGTYFFPKSDRMYKTLITVMAMVDEGKSDKEITSTAIADRSKTVFGDKNGVPRTTVNGHLKDGGKEKAIQTAKLILSRHKLYLSFLDNQGHYKDFDSFNKTLSSFIQATTQTENGALVDSLVYELSQIAVKAKSIKLDKLINSPGFMGLSREDRNIKFIEVLNESIVIGDLRINMTTIADIKKT